MMFWELRMIFMKDGEQMYKTLRRVGLPTTVHNYKQNLLVGKPTLQKKDYHK